jgi:hypothetical protein
MNPLARSTVSALISTVPEVQTWLNLNLDEVYTSSLKEAYSGTKKRIWKAGL